MGTRFTSAVVGSILLLGLGSRARADDAPAEDAAAMLRRARVAETVDHDLPKAMDLYRKVFAAAGDSDTSRDAALHLMDLLEARGDRPGALGFAKELSDRFTARLDDAMKRQVHETMARTLPAGSHAKSPLGDVYVLPAPGSASNPSPSPLETKIQAILSRLDGVGENARGPAEADVLSALRPVGADALTALERAMNDARPERARFAAQAIARIAPDMALPILLRAIKEGDGFARSAASGGLEAIVPSPSISKDFVAAVEPLLELPSLASRKSALVIALGTHLDASACLDRFERGGPFASAWLQYASQKDKVVTASRLAGFLSGRGVVPDWVAEEVAGVAGVDGGTGDGTVVSFGVTAGGVSTADRFALLEAVARGAVSETTLLVAASLAAALARQGEPDVAARASRIAWTLALDAGTSELVVLATRRLAEYGVCPDADVLAPPGRAERYAVAAAAAMAPSQYEGELSIRPRIATLLAASIRATSGPWEAIERMLASETLDASTRSRASVSIAKILGTTLPPAAEDARWLRVLARRPTIQEGHEDPITWIRRAAGRTNDPRFLELARADLKAAAERWKTRNQMQGEVFSYAAALTDNYRGPNRAAFALELIEMVSAFDPRAVAALSPWVGSEDEFWSTLLDRLPKYDEETSRRILGAVGRMGAPPSRFDARWIDELQRGASGDRRIHEFAVAPAARSGSSEYLKLLRRFLEAPPDPSDSSSAVYSSMLRGLEEFPDPARRTFLIGTLGDSSLDVARDRFGWVQTLWHFLEADPDPVARAGRLAIARNLTAPGNWLAIRALVVSADRATLVEILKDATASNLPLQDLTRFNIAEAAGVLHVREGIPFLTQEYARGSQPASAALDEIRAYDERMRAFEGAAGGRAPLAAELDAVTKGPTVELRRAAVFALAATHGVKAVPALLDIARTTADEPVRTAAIEMIEKLARGAAAEPAPAPKAPAPPAGTPPAASDSAK